MDMNAYFDLVYQYVPSTWVRRSSSEYSNSYILLDVEGNEYEEVARPFSHTIKSIKRVQNPYQLGLFRIQQERRDFECIPTSVATGYVAIHESDLSKALKYPLDYRRYTYKSCYHYDSKNPKIYSTPTEAISKQASNWDSASIVTIVTDYFRCDIETQGDYNPRYVVYLS